MPWTPNDAERHTHKATTWELKELWAKVANECLERTGDEGRAIREANAVVARRAEASYQRSESEKGLVRHIFCCGGGVDQRHVNGSTSRACISRGR